MLYIHIGGAPFHLDQSDFGGTIYPGWILGGGGGGGGNMTRPYQHAKK